MGNGIKNLKKMKLNKSSARKNKTSFLTDKSDKAAYLLQSSNIV